MTGMEARVIPVMTGRSKLRYRALQTDETGRRHTSDPMTRRQAQRLADRWNAQTVYQDLAHPSYGEWMSQ